MALEEKIVEWSKERPKWQRMVLRRIADGDLLSEKDYDKLTEDLVGGKRFEEVEFGPKQLPQSEPDDPPVALVSVSDPEHVNQLASDEPLAVSPTGLTLVYGDNASGKSGYARILKRIASARHQEPPILSDVFRHTSAMEPAAKLEVTVGDQQKSLTWPEDMPELRRMRFYDPECGKAYINTECDFPYQPSALALLEGLIQACTAVRSRIDDKLNANNLKAKTLPVVDEDCKDSEPGKFLSNLTGRSSIDKLDALIAGFKEERLPQVRTETVRLQNADTQREQSRLQRNARKLDAVAEHIDELEKALGTAAVRTLAEKRNALRRAEEAAKLAAAKFDFESEPLSDVGSQPWKTLWESARNYSEQHAYIEESFPAVGDDARCVLCQQELESDAKDRLTRFERFIKDDTQAKLNSARTDWQTLVSSLEGLVCIRESEEANLTDLATDHAALSAEAKTLVQGFDVLRTTLLEAIGTSADLPAPALNATELTTRLRAASKNARETSESLKRPEGIEQRLGEMAKETAELKLLRQMKSKRADIVHEIERRKERETLEATKTDAATTGISKQVTSLSKDSITRVVLNRFTREAHDLKLEHITMDTRARKGALVHKPTLLGAKQTVPVPRVFSEGEKTALGLASFFTEAEHDESKSALILDDPVNSLDHIRRGVVASRLVSFAQSRQVVVFTHDAAFVSDLKLEAMGASVNVSARSICRSIGGQKQPGKCRKDVPWKIQDVDQRFHHLENERTPSRSRRPTTPTATG